MCEFLKVDSNVCLVLCNYDSIMAITGKIGILCMHENSVDLLNRIIHMQTMIHSIGVGTGGARGAMAPPTI